MLVVRGYYRNRQITLSEQLPDHIAEAELEIIVHPKKTKPTEPISKSQKVTEGMVCRDEFESMGMNSFFEADDDLDVDWEDCFGLK